MEEWEKILAAVVQLGERIASLEERLNGALVSFDALPADAKAAHIARCAGKARGFFRVKEFAAIVGRSPQWVSNRCNARVIRSLPGGKPYRIPLGEEMRWNTRE